jgi:hypothetical protein
VRKHRAQQGTLDMFGDPKSQRSVRIHAEERARLLRQLPPLSNRALVMFVTAVFASDQLIAAYLMPLRSAPREMDGGDATALSQCLAAMERARRDRTLVLKSSWEPVAVALLVNPCGYCLCLRDLMFGLRTESASAMYLRISRVRAEVLSKPLQALGKADPQTARCLSCLLGMGYHEGLDVRRAVEMQKAVHRESLWMG